VALEIERKFLLERVPDAAAGAEGVPIRQGYLAIADTAEVRLRDKGGRFFEAVKIGRGLTRREYQVELTRDQFDVLWPATEGARLTKTRIRVHVDSSAIDIDVYDGDLHGLVVAEVEFGDEGEAAGFVPPSWFGTELTGDDRYANRSLAVDGLPGE
jgi:CYTH domain-containing protein